MTDEKDLLIQFITQQRNQALDSLAKIAVQLQIALDELKALKTKDSESS